MQSTTRKQRRIESGLQNPAPSSTKIHAHTKAPKAGTHDAFRTGRFNWRVPIWVNRSGKRVLLGFKLNGTQIQTDPTGYVSKETIEMLSNKNSKLSRMLGNLLDKIVNLLGMNRSRGIKLSYK